MFNVANRATLVNFVELSKTVIKNEMVVHIHMIKNVMDNLNMVNKTIENLLLEVKVVKTTTKKKFICFVGNGMHKVNDGSIDKVMVVVFVGETIFRTNVINRIRSLVCHTRCPVCNNK